MTIAMMIRSLSGATVMKIAKPRKQKLRKNVCPLPGIHQDDGIGAFLMTRKETEKLWK